MLGHSRALPHNNGLPLRLTAGNKAFNSEKVANARAAPRAHTRASLNTMKYIQNDDRRCSLNRTQRQRHEVWLYGPIKNLIRALSAFRRLRAALVSELRPFDRIERMRQRVREAKQTRRATNAKANRSAGAPGRRDAAVGLN
ncbi:hypothetical protein EVAR_64596_1 [Eumeta japonica]|uniref:Uncharacterized protein n=1 Tax=Eumeta variegata TaxID=151549 RepID=A0A4C1Z332_EUMVA|nr:hypothetical protein EVAR_64596_1 [Eumeta japonica]